LNQTYQIDRAGLVASVGQKNLPW